MRLESVLIPAAVHVGCPFKERQPTVKHGMSQLDHSSALCHLAFVHCLLPTTLTGSILVCSGHPIPNTAPLCRKLNTTDSSVKGIKLPHYTLEGRLGIGVSIVIAIPEVATKLIRI